jgi:hypothetical protein
MDATDLKRFMLGAVVISATPAAVANFTLRNQLHGAVKPIPIFEPMQ